MKDGKPLKCILGGAVVALLLAVTWSTSSARLSAITTSGSSVGIGSVRTDASLNPVRATVSAALAQEETQVTGGTVNTDKLDYQPGEMVIVTGNHWLAGETVHLKYVEDPSTHPQHEVYVIADANGNIYSREYTLEQHDLGVAFYLTATGLTSGNVATRMFADPALTVNLDQLQNGTPPPTNSEWANGDINRSNSIYNEGRSVPFRYFVDGVGDAETHHFTIQMEWTKGGVHAYDYLTSYDRTEATNIAAAGGPCGPIMTSPPDDCDTPAFVGVFPNPTFTGNWDFTSIGGSPPLDFFPVGFALDTPPDLIAYHATDVTFGKYFFSGTADTRHLNIVVTFTTTGVAATGGSAGFYWGGHLARGSETTWGLNKGAASVSGAPFHMRAIDFDDSGNKNQDRSIQLSAIVPICSITGPDTACSGSSQVYTATSDVASSTFSFTVTGSATLGSVTTAPDGLSATATVIPGSSGSYTVCVEVTGPNRAKSTCCTTATIGADPGCTITAPSAVCAESTGNTASVAEAGTGATHLWSITNGTIDTGQGTNSITWTAGSTGPVTLNVTVTTASGCSSSCEAQVTLNAKTTETDLMDLTKCAGESASFTTTASGTGPFSFSWTKNGSPISAGIVSTDTTSTLSIASVSSGDAGNYCVTVTGTCGSIEKCATLTVNENVTATDLTNLTKCPGESATFTTTGSGTGTLTYSWTKNGTTIEGATSNSLTINPISAGDAGNYCVTVSGTCGAPVQKCATLTVNENAALTDLTPQTVCTGESASFTTTATGTGPFTFSWTKNGSPITVGVVSTQTTSTLSIASVSAGDAGTYCVTVDGACGTDPQKCAALTIKATTEIATPPANQTACEGSTTPVNFSVSATGEGTLRYSWKIDGNPTGGDSSTISIDPSTLSVGDHSVMVTVTGECGSANASATLTVNAKTATTPLTPRTVCQGLTAEFSTSATGTGPFTYAWTLDGTGIGGNTATLTVPTDSLSIGTHNVCVTVSGTCGEPVQRCTTLMVNENVAATPLTPRTVCQGLPAEFSTSATGTGPLTYAWTLDGVGIGGNTSSVNLPTTTLSLGNHEVCVTVSGTCGTPVQRCTTLTVNENVAATPLNPLTVCQGQSAEFSTSATGTGPFHFSWTLNGSPAGGDSPNLTVPGSLSSGIYNVCVTVVGTCGEPVQRCTTLTVNENVAATPLNPLIMCQGQSAEFSTSATGTGPFHFSWTLNGSPAGGDSPNLTVPGSLSSGIYNVCVTVAGTCGEPVQRCTTLTVNENVAATPLNPLTVCQGQSADFSTSATGTGPFHFSWTLNGSPAGGDSSNLTLPGSLSSGIYNVCVTVVGTCGEPVQRCTTLTVNENVAATPLNPLTVCQGQSADFSTSATGTGPFHFSWTLNGSPAGGDSPSLTVPGSLSSGIYNVCVTVVGTCGVPVQRCTTLTVNENVAATPLSPLIVCQGQSADFSTSATGTGPFHFSWTLNGSSTGGDSPNLTLPDSLSSGIYNVCVTVVGACGEPVQSCTTLTVNENVTATDLTPRTVCAGESVSFTTTASGTGPFTFSWTRNGSPISAGVVSTETTSTLSIASVSAGDAGDYCVTVDGACGTDAQKCAALIVKSNTMTTPLSGQTVCQGLPAEFSTSATGEGTLTYAWTLDGAVTGGNTSTITVDTGSLTLGEHQVCVTVTGECGNVHHCATLVVQANTTITTPPAPTQVCFGSSVLQVFSVEASGTAPLTYAWTLDGVPFNGNSPSISIDPSALVVGIHSIGVTVAGSCGPALSANTTLTVNPLPVCTITGPEDVVNGSTVSYSVPEGASSYEWWITQGGNATIISGATSHEVSVLATGTEDSFSSFILNIKVTNAFGCVSTCWKKVTMVPQGGVTDTSRCYFDRDGDPGNGQQFRLILTQDPQNWPSYKVTATNPGQFFYNVFYTGTAGSMATFNIALPYPFVTQGANPVHAYAGVDVDASGGMTCLTPVNEFYVGSQQVGPVTCDPVTAESSGTITVTNITVPNSGFLFIAIHIDYGLKKICGGFDKDSNGNAVKAGTSEVWIPNLWDYIFKVTGDQTYDEEVQNINEFKRNPGIGGMSLNLTEDPVLGATITLTNSKGQQVGSTVTDLDGWYQIVYKHTGKAATYTVKIVKGSNQETKTVQLKANAFSEVNFVVP